MRIFCIPQFLKKKFYWNTQIHLVDMKRKGENIAFNIYMNTFIGFRMYFINFVSFSEK